MTRLATVTQPSPDPLAFDADESFYDCIEVTTTDPPVARVFSVLPRRTTTPRRGRVKPVVEILSPKKRGRLEFGSEVKRTRTPLATASPPSNRATPTPNGKGAPKGKELATPIKSAAKTPASRPSVTRSTKPNLASSVSKPLPTPSPAQSRKRPRLSSPADENVFEDPSPSSVSAISRETFLANEALRRQREARKFVYKGDANAPKLTRSGKVIGNNREETEEVDEYGGGVEDDAEEDLDDVQEAILQDEPVISLPTPKITPETPTKPAPLVSLPVSARPQVLQILSTLTSQNIAIDPPAFIDEEKNEALQGLVNLLKGTVERGEGNSALVIGARGVGKTRVSLDVQALSS